MVNSVIPSYPIFHDNSGRELEGGYIYVGVAGENPETNPVDVFFDTNLTLRAEQPVRTVAGRPTYNGKPVSIYAAGDYSLTVRDADNDLVYSTDSIELQLGAAFFSGSQIVSDGVIDGSASYPLVRDPGNAQNVLVFISGLGQIPDDDYTIVDLETAPSGKGIQFNSDVPDGAVWNVRYTATVPTSAAGNNVSEYYETRAELVDAVAGGAFAEEGFVSTAGGYEYVAVDGATRITDIPGFMPRGDWSVRHFGVVGDGDGAGGGTDDTTAISNLLNGLGQNERVIFDRDPITGLTHFNVTYVLYNSNSSIYNEIVFREGCRLFGIATSLQPAVLELKGINNHSWYNLTIATDGSASSPVHVANYECALKFSSKFLVPDGIDRPTQWNKFYGGQTRNIERGHVYGNIETQNPQTASPLSENFFIGHSFRGVMKPITMNAINAYVEYAQCLIVGQQFEASSTWWSNAGGYLIRSDNGSVVVTGGELQRAIAEGSGLYGKEIHVNGCICEWAATSTVTGQMSIIDPANSFYGPQTQTMFEVASNSTGTLTLKGQWEKNFPGSGGVSGLLVDSSLAPDFDYILDLDLVDFRWGIIDPLIVGGRPDIRRLTIRDNTTSTPVEYTVSPRQSAWDQSAATNNGENMTTTLSSADKAGWSQVIGSGADLLYGRYTTDLPPQTDASIRFQQTTSQVWIGTPVGAKGIRVGNKDSALTFYLKQLGNTDFFGVWVEFYGIDGASLGAASSRFQVDATSIANLNIDDDWQKFVVPLDPPDAARYVRVLLRGPTTGVCDMGITNINIVGPLEASEQRLGLPREASRADLVTWAASNTPDVGAVAFAGGLNYEYDGTSTTISDLPGWKPQGQHNLAHWGFVGDGTSADAARLQAAFTYSRDLVSNPEAEYTVDATTITITHPTTFDGHGAIFTFTGMGGYAGIDGFDVTMPLDAPFQSTTHLKNFSVLVTNSGRDGIKTPTNPSGNGSVIFNTIRPNFIFENLKIGGSTERFPSTRNLTTTDGWMNCIHTGESDNSRFSTLTFMQPFWPAESPASWGDKINTSCIRFSGITGAGTGAGAIRTPLVDHCLAHGPGRFITVDGFCSTLRVSNCDIFAGYYGGLVATGALSTSGTATSLTECSIERCQFNGLAGGCSIEATDFLVMDDVDITDPSITGATFTTNWIGVEVTTEFRQFHLQNCAFRAFRTDATNDHRAVKVQASTSSSNPSAINITNPHVSNRTSGASNFTRVFDLSEINTANIGDVFIEGSIEDLVHFEGSIWTSPRLNLRSQDTTQVSGDLVTVGSGVTWTNMRNIYAPTVGTLAATDTELPLSVISYSGTTTDSVVKFADGTMIQTLVINGVAGPTTASGGIFTNTEATYSFTEAFLAAPHVQVSVRSSAAIWGNGRSTSASQGAYRLFAGFSTAATVTIEVKATGRWR